MKPSYPMTAHYDYTGLYHVSNLSMNPGAASVTHQVYNMSSLYDPDFTGVGHQPLGFDQLMPLYDHYTVTSCLAEVTFFNTSHTDAYFAIISVRDESAADNDLDAAVENGRSSHCLVAPASSGGCVRTLTIGCNQSEFFGRPVLNGDKYQGTIAASPADAAWLHISVKVLGGADVSTCYATVKLTYKARLSEPKLLYPS